MHGPCLPRRSRGVGLARAARLPLVTSLSSLLAGCTEGAGIGPWIFGSVAMLSLGVGGFVLGTWRERRAGSAALHAARHDHSLLAGLIDCWTWQTDERHQLQRLQPPAGAPDAAWALADDAGFALWERFADEGSLRPRLQAQVPFTELRVRRQGDGSGWLLRGAPRFDDQGRFCGYAGTARPTDAQDASRTDQATLSALLLALDSPLLVARGDGSPGGWQLQRLNPAAERFFEGSTALPWAEVLQRIPSPLRNAIAELREDGGAEHEGWRLRRFGGAEQPGLLLLKLPEPDPDGAAGDSASLSFTVSHDLRAPVRVVEGFTRILKEDYGRQLDRVGNDHLDRVLGAAARMNHMIDALLTLAKLSQQPLARQPVNLSQLAAYVVDDLRRGTPERTAEIEIEPGLQANGDPTLLRLVLENLLGNAWKYSARTKKTHIVFGAVPHEGRRAFVVRDNGAGFDMRSADRLFGLFQRLHGTNDFPGTGVGLASVRRIVRRHGGDVWADAEPGRGAAFYFTLKE